MHNIRRHENKVMWVDYIMGAIILVAVLDLMVLGTMIMTLATGGEVMHIPFWDTQLEFFINLMS